MIGRDSWKWLLIILVAILHHVNSVSGTCQFSFIDRKKLYNYSLASPLPKFPHGILSEDGFYKVAMNETVLWFQLCDGMLFNHDPPKCADCLDCGGPLRCGLECSALASNNIGGYHVCTSVGHVSSTHINVIDKRNPHKGVVVKMSSNGRKYNCSLSVSIICDSKRFQGPQSMEMSGTCDYATTIQHPSGCAKIISVNGGGWGWFGTLIIIMLCLLGIYLLAGAFYRYYFLGVHGPHVIPNLDFWSTVPHRIQSLFASLVRKFRGPSQGHRSTYSRVNF